MNSKRRRSDSSSSSNSQKCLICQTAGIVHPEDTKEFQQQPGVDFLTHLFRILCMHMNWKATEDQQFTFKTEMFPFCNPCREDLVNVYSVNERLEAILNEMKALIINISAKILISSSRSRNYEEISRNDTSGAKRLRLSVGGEINQGTKIISQSLMGNSSSQNGNYYNLEKVRHFRDLTIQKFSPLVVARRTNHLIQRRNSSTIPKEDRTRIANSSDKLPIKEKSEDCNPELTILDNDNIENVLATSHTEEIDKDSSFAELNSRHDDDSFSAEELEDEMKADSSPENPVSAAEVTTTTLSEPESPIAKKICRNTMGAYRPIDKDWNGSLKGRIRKINNDKFIFDNKYQFLHQGNTWLCLSCDVKFHKHFLELHLLSGCKGKKKKNAVQKSEEETDSPEVTELAWSEDMKQRTKKLGPWIYLFDDKNKFELHSTSGVWICKNCNQKFPYDIAIASHLLFGCKERQKPARPNCVKTRAGKYEFEGFSFVQQQDKKFKCAEKDCYYSAKTTRSMMRHISNYHVSQLPLAPWENECDSDATTIDSETENMDWGD